MVEVGFKLLEFLIILLLFELEVSIGQNNIICFFIL